MAFEKKPLQDGVKTKLKDYSVDFEGRVKDEFDLIGSQIDDLLLFSKAFNKSTNEKPINNNLNSNMPVGVYYVEPTTDSGNGEYAVVYHMKPLPGFTLQISFGMIVNKVRYRKWFNGQWSSWTTIY